MSTNRRIVCEAAFGFGPFDTLTESDWTELVDTTGPRVKEASWQFGRSDELEQFETGTATVVLRNRDRALDPDNPSSPYAGDLLPYTPVRLRSVGPTTALDLPGTGTAATPDHAAFAITDLDVTIRLALDDWTPAATAILIAQNGIFADIGWSFEITTSGLLSLKWSPDGTSGATLTRNTTAAPGFLNGSDHMLRVTLDVNDGAGNRVVTFYVDGAVYESFTTAGTTTIFNSTQALTIGVANTVNGNVRSAELQASINGATVTNPDFMTQLPGATSFVDDLGRTWTLSGSAVLAVDPALDVYFDEFYGFVETGWQQQLAPIGASDCVLDLVDLLGVISGRTLPDVFHKAILDHDPVGFWVLDAGSDVDAEQVADQGSANRDGIVMGDGINLGDRVISPGHQPAARFDNEYDASTGQTTFGTVDIGRSTIIPVAGLADALLVVTFQARSKAVEDRRVLFVQATGTNVDKWPVAGGIEAHIATDGTLVYGNGTTLTGASSRSVVDGHGHIVFAAGETLGVDTATLSGSGATLKSISTVNGVGIGGAPGLRPQRYWDGWIGVAALFASNTTVGSSGRSEILAGYGKLSGQRSDQHITWALDYLGVPTGLRNLATGTVIMGPAVTDGKDALAFMREVAATEGGSLYVDHRDGGKIRFTDRYHRFLQTRSTTSQATFTDDPAAPQEMAIRYAPEGLNVSSNGLDGVINQVTVSWTGGEVTVDDATSIATYGPRARTVETVATTANQARSAAEWLLVRYAQPRSRIRGAVASRRHTADRHNKVQGLKIHDRVTFRIQPLHIGTAATVTLYIDGVSHAARGVEWETAFRFAQGETFTPWIWGMGAWGTTAYWG